MATAVQRVPFGEISQSRLRRLTSAKNCQNAVTQSILAASKEKSFFKPSNVNFKPATTLNAPTKRAYEPSVFEDDSDPDTENVDPSVFSPKRSKTNDGISKPINPHFVLKTETGSVKAPPGSEIKRKATPPPYQFPGGASTAPAGRSPPKHRRVGLLNLKRISPPNFGASGIPFSIDAALRGTSALVNKTNVDKVKHPKTWYFEIYEDKPDEIAANIMEHSAGMLDLSSDDEVKAKMKDERGKENVPPADYVPPTANGVQADGTLGKPTHARRGVRSTNAMVMDEVPRVALASLPVQEFYAEGLDASSVFHVPEDDDLEVATDIESGAAAAVKAQDPGFVIAEDKQAL